MTWTNRRCTQIQGDLYAPDAACYPNYLLFFEVSRVGTIFKLIIEDDEGKTTVFPLSDTQLSIGRKDGNTIRLMERNVSRRHAKLTRENGNIFIEDLDSYNGIRINGERISGRYEVKEGDLVEIGDYHLALQAAEVRDAVETRAAEKSGASDRPTDRPPEAAQLAGPAQAGLATDRSESSGDTEPDALFRDTVVDRPISARGRTGTGDPRNETPSADAAPEAATSPFDVKTVELPPFPPARPTPASARPETGDAAVSPSESSGPTRHAPARVATAPRLICVSTTHAGREFSIERSEMVIGRVDENDIAIDHRSVSRSHAKILFDGRVHKVIDLQSANGILVNGEEYAMTDLRAGDLIELGHVRFRYVPADSPFDPTAAEIREMEAAGVPALELRDTTRPRAASAPGASAMQGDPMEGAVDPSNAATVTDTPLDVLRMNRPASPEVTVFADELAREDMAKQGPRAEAGVDTYANVRSGARAEAKAAGNAPRAPAQPARTALKPPRAGTPVPVTGRVQGARRTPTNAFPIGKVVMLATGALLAIVAVLAWPDRARRGGEEIAAAYERGDLEAADAACKRHESKLSVQAAKVCGRVEAELEKRSARAMEPDGARDRAEPIPANVEARPTPENVARAIVVDDTPAKTSARAEATPPRKVAPALGVETDDAADKKKLAKAKQLHEAGNKAFYAGDLARAQQLAEQCLETAPLPDCHRSLGIIHAKLHHRDQSIRHYKQYVELAPDAPDAAKVRSIVREVENEP